MFSGFFGAGSGGGGHDRDYYQTGAGHGHDQGRGYGGGGNIPPANSIFMRSYKAYSPAFIGKPEVNKGNKIILPGSALHELARLRISYPMTFMISNP
jgi:hypothetical protein